MNVLKLSKKINDLLGPISIILFFYLFYFQKDFFDSQNNHLLFVITANFHFPLTIGLLTSKKEVRSWVSDLFRFNKWIVCGFFLFMAVIFLTYLNKDYFTSRQGLPNFYFNILTQFALVLHGLHLTRQQTGLGKLLYPSYGKIRQYLNTLFSWSFIANNCLAVHNLTNDSTTLTRDLQLFAIPFCGFVFFARIIYSYFSTKKLHFFIYELRSFIYMLFPMNEVSRSIAGGIHSLEYGYIQTRINQNATNTSSIDRFKWGYPTLVLTIVCVYLLINLVRVRYVLVPENFFTLFFSFIVTYNIFHIIVDWALFSNYFKQSPQQIKPLLKEVAHTSYDHA